MNSIEDIKKEKLVKLHDYAFKVKNDLDLSSEEKKAPIGEEDMTINSERLYIGQSRPMIL